MRGEALLKIAELAEWINTSSAKAAPKQKANMLFALSQIDEFKKDANKFKVPAVMPMPAGAPIMGAMDFLDCDLNMME